MKYLLLACLYTFLLSTNGQVRWISPANGVYEYQSIAENNGDFYALFKGNFLVSKDTFRHHNTFQIPDSLFTKLGMYPRIFVMDSLHQFISCSITGSNAIYTVDGGISWKSAGRCFTHFNFNGDSITAVESANLYAYKPGSDQWVNTFRATDNLGPDYQERFQLFGDTLINLQDDKLTIQHDSGSYQPKAGNGNHKYFRFFNHQEGFLVAADSVFYTEDGGVTFRVVCETRTNYSMPTRKTLVYWHTLDTVRLTHDAGKTWSSHYVPIDFGNFRPAGDQVIMTQYGQKAILFDYITYKSTNLVRSVTSRDLRRIGQVDHDHYFMQTPADTSFLLELSTAEVRPAYTGPIPYYATTRFGDFQGKRGFLYSMGDGFVSSDGGHSWTRLSGYVPYFDHVSFSGQSTMLGCMELRDSTAFYYSDDYGHSWKELYREKTKWPVTAFTTMGEKSLIVGKDDSLIYYEFYQDSLYRKPLKWSGVKVLMDKVNDSTAVTLDYSFGNHYTRDRGLSWKKLPDFPYAPFIEYIVRTTPDEKFILYDPLNSTIHYCLLADSSFTSEKFDAPPMADMMILNDSTLLFTGSDGKIITYRLGQAFAALSIDKPEDQYEEDEPLSEIVVYPNPASGPLLSVEYPPAFLNGQWSIHGTSGEEYNAGTLPNESQCDLDVNDLQSGIYILRLTNGHQQMTIKFIRG